MPESKKLKWLGQDADSIPDSTPFDQLLERIEMRTKIDVLEIQVEALTMSNKNLIKLIEKLNVDEEFMKTALWT